MGGGPTLDAAFAAAEYGLRQMVFQPHPLLPGIIPFDDTPRPLTGAESPVPIRNT